jgi:hypothetical protein
MTPSGPGSAAIRHENDPGVWDGPTGFYDLDYRAPMAADETKVWESIYLWADPTYTSETMFLTFMSDTLFVPPSDRRYFLELVDVPAGYDWPEETLWEVPADGLVSLELRTFNSTDGLEGYEFSFTIGEVIPEPGTGSLLGLAAVLLLKPWRGRFFRHR